MIDPSWQFDEPVSDAGPAEGAAPSLVSLHFLRTAVRRRRRLVITLALVGMLLGVAYNQFVPTKSSASVTILLAHDPQTDPTRAMATDVTLLSTRKVADAVIAKLNLPLTAQDLLQTVSARAVTDQVLELDVTAPDRAAAVARAQTLADSFLAFRTAEYQRQLSTLADGYNQRINSLQAQVTELNTRYNTLTTQGQASEASSALTEKSTLESEINSLQQTVQLASLGSTYITSTSHVLDPATANPRGAKKRAVLDVVSGLIGGAAVGIGLVLFLALTSSRLIRREDVSTALATPVMVSVGKLRRGGRLRRRLMRRRVPRGKNLDILVHALDSAIPSRPKQRVRLALASVESEADATPVLATLAARLHRRGLSVFAVDLSEHGRLDRTLSRALAQNPSTGSDAPVAPEVFRPDGVPSLARGPLGLPLGADSDLPVGDPRRRAWDKANIVLTLAEIDPAVGAEHLTSWANEAVVFVTAGVSSAERLRTTAELLRRAGLRLIFAVMVGADATDESLGVPDEPQEASRVDARSTLR